MLGDQGTIRKAGTTSIVGQRAKAGVGWEDMPEGLCCTVSMPLAAIWLSCLVARNRVIIGRYRSWKKMSWLVAELMSIRGGKGREGEGKISQQAA